MFSVYFSLLLVCIILVSFGMFTLFFVVVEVVWKLLLSH